jgi:hypothetical protein
VSLTIEAGSGADTITVKSLDPGFAADLLLYGNTAGAPTLEPDAGHDVVHFDGNLATRGGYLEVFADEIFVKGEVGTVGDPGYVPASRSRPRRRPATWRAATTSSSARAASARPRSRTCCRRAT